MVLVITLFSWQWPQPAVVCRLRGRRACSLISSPRGQRAVLSSRIRRSLCLDRSRCPPCKPYPSVGTCRGAEQTNSKVITISRQVRVLTMFLE